MVPFLKDTDGKEPKGLNGKAITRNHLPGILLAQRLSHLCGPRSNERIVTEVVRGILLVSCEGRSRISAATTHDISLGFAHWMSHMNEGARFSPCVDIAVHHLVG